MLASCWFWTQIQMMQRCRRIISQSWHWEGECVCVLQQSWVLCKCVCVCVCVLYLSRLRLRPWEVKDNASSPSLPASHSHRLLEEHKDPDYGAALSLDLAPCTTPTHTHTHRRCSKGLRWTGRSKVRGGGERCEEEELRWMDAGRGKPAETETYSPCFSFRFCSLELRFHSFLSIFF